MLDAMRNLCTSRTLSNWIEDTLANNPFVIPAANGAHGHGVRRLQALSFGVLFLHIMAQAQDYTRVIGAIQITRGLPIVPQMASFFQQITRNPALRFRQWFSQDMEFIGLNFLAAHRPQYILSADFMGTLMFYLMRDENRPETN